jgi:hypothetical protein
MLSLVSMFLGVFQTLLNGSSKVGLKSLFGHKVGFARGARPGRASGR